MTLPTIAITMGDPAGIGPEVIVGAWEEVLQRGQVQPLVLGHPEVLRRAVRLLGKRLEVVEIATPQQASPSRQQIPCLMCVDDAAAAALSGAASAVGGQAAYDALIRAAALALAGDVDAITTAPLSKKALWDAGHSYPGHTELLAELCGVPEVAMMLYLPPGPALASPTGLGVIHVTLHQSLRSAVEGLNSQAILKTARLAHGGLSDPEGNAPRLGVCALNPHAGEDGLFGDEEARIILPAVEQGCREGMRLTGPLPADTLLVRARNGEFDGVVAMYHDQGHIALKLLGMHSAVNVTLGLPIIRTSVAHGTAFDRAWRGVADCGGMLAALEMAGRMVRLRWERQS